MAAVDAFTDRNHAAEGERVGGMRTDMSDLIADVLHLADRFGVDAEGLLSKARESYDGDGEDGPRVLQRFTSDGRELTLDELAWDLVDDVALGNSEYESLGARANALLLERRPDCGPFPPDTCGHERGDSACSAAAVHSCDACGGDYQPGAADDCPACSGGEVCPHCGGGLRTDTSVPSLAQLVAAGYELRLGGGR